MVYCVTGVKPACRYVNVQLCGGLSAGEGRSGTQATVLLENPVGQNLLSLENLKEQVISYSRISLDRFQCNIGAKTKSVLNCSH